MNTLVIAGSGRYSDPWHPFAASGRAVGALLSEDGHDVTVRDDVETALVAAPDYDLVVVNTGDPWSEDGATTRTAPEHVAALDAALDAGVGFLALHISVASLRQYPAWAEATGAIWVPGASFHPELGSTRITVDGSQLPGAPADFDVIDERYCRLQFVGSSVVVATHPGEHGPEPTAWLRRVRNARVAVDVLGHDERSYESVGHRQLVQALARWAARAR